MTILAIQWGKRGREQRLRAPGTNFTVDSPEVILAEILTGRVIDINIISDLKKIKEVTKMIQN